MNKSLILIIFIFLSSCQSQDDSNCSISIKEELFNDYIDSILIKDTPETIIPIVEGHLKRHPENVVSINNLAALKYQLYKKAKVKNKDLELELLESFNSVLLYCPTYKASLENLIELNYDFGNYEKSVEVSKKYLLHHPENSAIMTRISDSYRELSDYSNCLKYANRGLELDSECTFCYTLKGIALFELGKFNEAIIELNKSKEIESNNLNNLFLGNCYMNLKKDNLAIEHYLIAIELDSTKILPFLSIANMYKMKGNISLACEFYEIGFTKNYSKNNERVKISVEKSKEIFEELCIK